MRTPDFLTGLLGLGLLAGCNGLIGAKGHDECATDGDCLNLERCDTNRGRCVDTDQGVFTEAGLNGFGDVRDAAVDGPADIVSPPFDRPPPVDGPVLPDVPDLATDLGVPDMAEPDAGPPGAYAPEGDCFGGALRGQLAGVSGATGAKALCTDDALVFATTDLEGVQHLQAQTGGAARTLLTLPAGATWTVGEGTLLATVPREADGLPNVVRLNLLDPRATPTPVEARAAVQSQPVRAHGRSIFVEAPPGTAETAVLIHADDGTAYSCGRPGVRQWSPVAGDRFVAFFERPVAGGPADLVITHGESCTPRSSLSVPGELANDASVSLVQDDGRLFWLAVDPSLHRRLVYTVDALRPGAGPVPFSANGITITDPVELAAHAHWLFCASYEGGTYTSHLYQWRTGAVRRPAAGGNTRSPSLSGTYSIWAEQNGTRPWEVHYEQLPSP